MLQYKLVCPACNAINRYENGRFFDGMETGCLRCGTELIMSREWDEFNDSYKWRLLIAAQEQESEF